MWAEGKTETDERYESKIFIRFFIREHFVLFLTTVEGNRFVEFSFCLNKTKPKMRKCA